MWISRKKYDALVSDHARLYLRTRDYGRELDHAMAEASDAVRGEAAAKDKLLNLEIELEETTGYLDSLLDEVRFATEKMQAGVQQIMEGQLALLESLSYIGGEQDPGPTKGPLSDECVRDVVKNAFADGADEGEVR